MSGIKHGELVDGRYLIDMRLGTGGMADVFLAEDQQLERKIALKLLHRRFAEDPGFVERFRREAQSAANLQHPHVVAVYDRGSWDGTYYIAMEYLQGRTLKQVIREQAPLDPIRSIDIAIQILKATCFAHRRGVIHRDLKPHNVMLDEDDHVKVTDFGIARAGASDMTETGSIMGTAQYLSPEQAQGLSVAESSDLYSIGIVLYEMLTGRVPFDAESAVTIALKHVSEAPVPPSRYNPQIPPALEQTVLWALNKNASDRPQDADTFIDVLERVRESLVGGNHEATATMGALGVGAVAAGSGPLPKIQLGARPLNEVYAPVTGESAAIPVVGTYGPEPPPPDRDNPMGWRRLWPWLLALLVLLLIAGGVVAFLATRPHKGTIPDVVNDTQSTADSRVEAAGFNPSIIPQASSSAPVGTVIYQSPLAGTVEDTNRPVDLTVSTGPGSTTVPAVVQDSRAQAIVELKRHGLSISKILTESSSTIQKGEATRTDPDAGTSLQTGQGVILYISSGTAPISVPTVTGDSQQVAQSAIESAGFTKVTVTQQVSSTQTPGTVLSQTPAGGTATASSTPITLTVAEKAPTVSVPDLTGETLSQATATLTGLGLAVKSSTQPTSDQTQNGQVVSQTPAANAKSATGATVTVVIAKYSATTTATSTTSTATGTSTTGTTSTPTGTTGSARVGTTATTGNLL